ncbi:hypothetical protein M408DRAFT_65529 [Serendipita vermifera MAFF 305830]|uniref:PITH domain-containing protein n=1 Tax=Serendipita vermifera MAFF 305830 TaxID=933852 RepID=A0A0C3BFN2_SERVB|nr:hypothetical protein M408DRAFT_65529 [Serendipita vermifera MAFF 305830]
MSGHGCHDEHDGHEHGGHSHSHDAPLEDIPRETLYSIIDHQNVLALNVVQQNNILKPWEDRNDESVYLESDEDTGAEMMIKIPFADSSAKLLSMLVKSGPGEQTASVIKLFVNEDNLDFDDVANRPASQEFEIPISREVGEYQLRPAKFSNVRTLTIYIPDAQGADSVRLYYLGFTGSFQKMTNQPIITVYESRPQLADHKNTGIHEVAQQQF